MAADSETLPKNRMGQGDSLTIMFRQQLTSFAAEFDQRFMGYLQPSSGRVPPGLVEVVHYSALSPGKRIRPYLVVRCCELAGGDRNDAWHAAAAVECIHAFSLIHDDLPAMDNDDLRRGQPTTHKKFGEAMAILAGDALVVLAFDLLVRHATDHSAAAKMIAALAEGTGWTGMIGGQSADVIHEGKPCGREIVDYIHSGKTASLFRAAARIGALAGGGRAETIDRLGWYAQELGRAFQIADDLLDLHASAGSLGKNVGKDAKAAKQTYPQNVGIEESRRAANAAAQAAIDQLEGFQEFADDLRWLARFVVDRNI